MQIPIIDETGTERNPSHHLERVFLPLLSSEVKPRHQPPRISHSVMLHGSERPQQELRYPNKVGNANEQHYCLPVRIGFLLNTFTFGGSETEVIELIGGADPQFLQFV